MGNDSNISCEPGDGISGNDKSLLYKIVIFTVGAALMAAIVLLPSPEPLERAGETIPLTFGGKATLGLLVMAIVLWITEVIPFSVTAILVMLLIPVFGIETFKNTVKLGFGNPIIAFFIGVLTLSSAFSRSGLGKRLSYIIISIVGTGTRMVVLGFLIIGAMLSMWVTDMAVAAMLMPLGASILKQCDVKPLESNFGRALMISTAWGPLFGGIATPAGCGPNILTISFLKELSGININFLQWMTLGLPASILMIPAGWLILTWMFPPEFDRLPFERDEIRKYLKEMGGFSGKEIWTMVIFLVTISGWILSPIISRATGGAVQLPMQAVALGGAVLLFLPGIEILSWKEAQADIDWGGIVLICAGISLGMVVYHTGAARWLSWILLGPIVQLPGILRIFLIVIIVSILHMAFSSNTVTGTIIIPLLIALAGDLGINPWLITAPAAFTSSLAFILVTETPTNVIPYSAGYFAIKDMAKAGIIMTVCAAAIVGVVILVMGQVSGLYMV